MHDKHDNGENADRIEDAIRARDWTGLAEAIGDAHRDLHVRSPARRPDVYTEWDWCGSVSPLIEACVDGDPRAGRAMALLYLLMQTNGYRYCGQR